VWRATEGRACLSFLSDARLMASFGLGLPTELVLARDEQAVAAREAAVREEAASRRAARLRPDGAARLGGHST
jgi:hypothetical protein